LSDAIPIPTRPSLEQYKKQAKDLLKACQSADRAKIRAWMTRILEPWARNLEHEVARMEERLRDRDIAKLADAQFFLAREHGYQSWPKFVEEIQSPNTDFEAAADAIVSGDIATLRRMLREKPELIRQRSTRREHAPLLHYVAANGIEDFRQRTPSNIVAITKLLLDSGADVNAESDAYRGHSTALGLVATSIHPYKAGVQNALMELLLERGAVIERTAVCDCLANGRGPAAEFLASHGAPLDFATAAGVGWLDYLKAQTSPTKKQREVGFRWACQYGKRQVVEYLLEQGVDVSAMDDRRMTGLHWAAFAGHLDLVKLLLARNAPLELINAYGGTVLSGAVWAAIINPKADHLKIIETLVDAGAKVSEDWFAGYREIDAALGRGQRKTVS
jgi:ankyrin repeat protein